MRRILSALTAMLRWQAPKAARRRLRPIWRRTAFGASPQTSLRPRFDATNGGRNHAVDGRDRQAPLVGRRDRREADRRSLGISRKNRFEQLRQLLARWTIRHLVAVCHDL